MKKLMVIAAVVMAVVGAKAAAVDWTASAVYDAWTTAETGKNTAADGWLGYVVLASDYSNVVAGLKEGDTSALLDSAVGPVKTSSKGKFTALGATGSVAAGNQSFYLIVLNNGTLKDATAFATSDAVSANIDASLDTTIAFGSMANATKTVDSWTAMAPEPTSGLLLLIGCAGLALRRRRS